MSIIQGLLGSIGASPPPNYWMGLSGNYGEGHTLSLYVNWQYAKGTTIYWTIASDSAIADTDFTSDNGYSGSLTVSGSGSQNVANITYVADNLTEGTEWFTIKLGTTEGGNDLYSTSENINDTSIGRLADFTIEWWQNMNSSQSSYPRLFDVGSYPSENPGISFEGNPYYGSPMVWGGGTSDRVYGVNFVPNEWVHWAIARYNNAIALYKNGSNILNSNNLGVVTFNNTSSQLTIGTGSGQYWQGKIAGFHWIKGTAKYTTDFNPIKAPPSAIANSKLLLNVVDDTNKYVDSSASGFTPNTTTNISFNQDTPWYYNSVTNTLSGAGTTLGIFADTSKLGWLKIKPGWTITRVAGGWSSTVVSFNGASEIVAADSWLNDASDYTFAPPASIVYNTNSYGGVAGVYELQFNTSYTNLENVKSGWTVTNGSWSDTVIFDAYTYAGAYRVKVAGTVEPPGGDYTFTPPTQTGSLAFSNGTLAYNANNSWAFDV